MIISKQTVITTAFLIIVFVVSIYFGLFYGLVAGAVVAIFLHSALHDPPDQEDEKKQ